MKYTCPVCAYDSLNSPPQDYTICPCCGTEFGYHDFALTHLQLRSMWLDNGAKWHSRRTLPPAGWTSENQLIKAGISPAKVIRTEGHIEGHFVKPAFQNPYFDLLSENRVRGSFTSASGDYQGWLTAR